MKVFSLIMLVVLIGTGFTFVQKGKDKVLDEDKNYFRIHIVANSNSTVDQEIKFSVKSAIVEYLTPIVADCQSEAECVELVKSKLAVLNCVVQTELKNQKVEYGAKVDILKKEFPTRYYENFVLEQGVWDCIYVELGQAEGDNWWCVAYPPLCFMNKNKNEEQDIVYQSKILEIIKRHF